MSQEARRRGVFRGLLRETHKKLKNSRKTRRNFRKTQKAIKKYQQQVREGQAKLEEEQRAKEAARDALVGAERRAHAMQNGLEEARTLLEQADRNRRATEIELSDINEQLSDATVQNQAIAAAKRKMELEMQTLHVSILSNYY